MVIYDAHENLPDDVMEKQWLPVRTRSAISRSASVVEREFTKRLSAVVAATPHICDRFSKFHKRAITVKNYPLLQELQFSSSYVPFAERRSVTYIGTITADRGIEEMVLGVADTTLTLEIAGAFSYQAEREAIIALPQWDAVKELGRISRSGVVETLRRSLAGLVVLHPTPAFVTSLPIKMFEYMAAGIPVVASDFPSWREIIEKHRCGICVPARQPAAIAGALRWLVANPSAAQDMGERGLEAVKLYYNWEAESARLIQLYEELVFERRRLHKAAEAPNLTTES
jgi:glycosyltransferase involved in cell wall biosynthesis